MNYCLYNPLANNKRGHEKLEELSNKISDTKNIDVTLIDEKSTRALCEGMDKTADTIYLIGGDGTLHKFANYVYGLDLPPVYFCPAGIGNDFCNDIGMDKLVDGMVKVNDYIKNLPIVSVNGQNVRFVNGVGYGIDGVCCEIADEIREKSDKKISYTMIALKQCLYKYKRRDATVIVDGVTSTYKNVWICPCMKGRFYGGGMMVAPKQDRLSQEKTVTVVVGHGKSRLKMLLTFPKLIAGKHENNPMCKMLVGKEITVKFTVPCALQVDGETIKNVSEYTVKVQD